MLRTRAGQEIPVSQAIIAPPDADRRCEFLALIARDVQAMKQAEESLRKSEQFYRRIAEGAPVGIWVIDRENQTTFVNPKMAKTLGYSVDEMVGKPALNLFFTSAITLPGALDNASQFMFEEANALTLRRKDGAELCVRLCPSPLFNEQEQYMGTLAMVSEIAESRWWRDLAQLQSGIRSSGDAFIA